VRCFALTPLLLLALSGCASDEPKLGGPGESCTKRADCRDGLGCFDLVCGQNLQAVQAMQTARAKQTTTAQTPRNPAVPSSDAQAAPPAPAPELAAAAEATNEEGPQALAVVGPFESLDAYCPTRKIEGNAMSCNFMMRPKFIDGRVGELARVRDYYVGSDATGGSRGVAVQTAKGIYFVEDIAGEAVGKKVGSRVVGSSMINEGKGSFQVTMKLESWKLAGESKETTNSEVHAQCVVTEGGPPRCWFGTEVGGK
jgi:hypothetical protein